MLRLASLLADNARPIYERIAGYVAERLGVPVSLLAEGPREERFRRLDAGDVDVAFLCGLPYSLRHDSPGRPIELVCAPVMAAPRYGGRPVYFTDVIVRREHPARAFADLRGRVFGYNDDGSHSGYNVVRHHLLAFPDAGGYFGRVVASGGHQKSIEMVVGGGIDAAGIDSTVLETEMARRPELGAALRTIATLGPSPIPPVVVLRRLDPTLKARLRDLFLGMAADPAGQAVLAEGRMKEFVPVEDADYDPIREMVRRAAAVGRLVLR